MLLTHSEWHQGEQNYQEDLAQWSGTRKLGLARILGLGGLLPDAERWNTRILKAAIRALQIKPAHFAGTALINRLARVRFKVRSDQLIHLKMAYRDENGSGADHACANSSTHTERTTTVSPEIA